MDIDDKTYIELNLNFKFKNGEGRDNAYTGHTLQEYTT